MYCVILNLTLLPFTNREVDDSHLRQVTVCRYTV